MTNPHSSEDFFVGYLAIPKSYKKVLLPLVVLFLCLFFTLGIFIAFFQQSPRDGVGWDPTGVHSVSIFGKINTHPYDMIHFKSVDGSLQTALLTSMVKTDIHERIKFYDQKNVHLKGMLIQQDGRYVFSVLDDSTAIQLTPDEKSTDTINSPTPHKVGTFWLKGQIIDPKCYLGAMKPGGGKVHKSCAILCIKGGIPPMFVVRTKGLKETYYLMLDEKGEPIRSPLYPFVGDPVQVYGSVEQWGNLLVFKVNTASIKRI